MMVGLEHYLIVAMIIFVIGIFGMILNRRNLILFLLSIELILLSINLNFVAFSTYLQDVGGQVFALFVLASAAAETAIGLAIFVNFYMTCRTIVVDKVNILKG